MFEVEPNLWLQSFASPWLTALMQVITFFGYDWLYAAAVIGLGFGLRLRPMLGVMLALLLAGLCTHATKQSFALPRPVQVDARVLDKGATNEKWQVREGGAAAFLTLPAAEAIAAQRAARHPDFGFISGHVAAASALCGSLLLMFGIRTRWLRIALLLWPLLMALSRMYLGRHFLADALAGTVVGNAAAGLAWCLWRPTRQRGLFGLALALCLATPWVALLDRSSVGQLLGLVITGALLQRCGWPDDQATPWKRAVRVGVAFALYVLVKPLLDTWADAAGWPEDHLMSVPLAALGTMCVLLGGVCLSRMLGLYRSASSEAGRTAL